MSLFKKQEQQIIDYIPQQLEEPRSKNVSKFISSQDVAPAGSFEVNPVVSEQIGLAEYEEANYKKKFDAEVLRYVQKIKEDAYQESYEKGLKEGVQAAKQEALEQEIGNITDLAKSLQNSLDEVESYKEQIYASNKQEIISLCYYLAEKIICSELEKNEGFVSHIVEKIVLSQDKSEQLTILLSPENHTYLLANLDSLANDLKDKRIQWKVDVNLNKGDVILQNSKGLLIGTLESRLEKIKSLMGEMS